MESDQLWNVLINEYAEAERLEKSHQTFVNDKSDNFMDNKDNNLRTVRIFISSTFRDFHNERNVLVTKVFPRLREWCNSNFLHLVECDLRWGIPTYVSREETVITCLDEIERGRIESHDMNFFLGLLGERYGWIPDDSVVSEFIKTRYKWIDGSSVTLMEFLHGLIRSLTPNGLILFRDTSFVKELPDKQKLDFIETDPIIQENLELFKNFLKRKFEDKGLVQYYSVDYAGITYDKLIQQERVEFTGFQEFENIVEKHFKCCITKNLIKPTFDEMNKIDIYHKYMVNCLSSNCRVEPSTVGEIMEKVYQYLHVNTKRNPILILSGEAGVGKSTILAQCVKKLENKPDYSVFFHSFSCTLSSQYRESLLNRLYNFIVPNSQNVVNDMKKKDKIDQIIDTISIGNMTTNKKYVIILDGIDEVCKIKYVKWLCCSTNNNVCIVISCLLDKSCESFYNIFKDQFKNIEEIAVKPLDRQQLITIVVNYLWEFGKRLENEQLDALMGFEISNNPLWLISACEELRIHGDFSTVLKLINILPKSLMGINQAILKRLLQQDDVGYLRALLIVLVESRAGVWENLGKVIIARLCHNSEIEIISHCSWLELIRQIKGFLQMQSIPLPLIKFRHRVMKDAVRMELDIDEPTKIRIHSTLVDIYEPLINDGFYLTDYLFHLLKSKKRSKLLKLMHSRLSWMLLKSSFIRRKFIQSMRCNKPVVKSQNNSPNYLKLCMRCSHSMGQFSIYAINKMACYLCGNVIPNSVNTTHLYYCSFHTTSSSVINKCTVCHNIAAKNFDTPVKICGTCQMMSPSNNCGMLVMENDILFKQQMTFSELSFNLLQFI